MKELRFNPGIDFYWDAIPLNEIHSLVQPCEENIWRKREYSFHKCIEDIILSSVCVCVLNEKHIVAEVIKEFERVCDSQN